MSVETRNPSSAAAGVCAAAGACAAVSADGWGEAASMESVSVTAEDARPDGSVRGVVGCAPVSPFCCAALLRITIWVRLRRKLGLESGLDFEVRVWERLGLGLNIGMRVEESRCLCSLPR